MLAEAITAVSTIFTWPAIVFLIAGVLIGMIFGAMPGLGGIVVLSLLLPISIGFGAETTMVLFGAALGGVAFGGSISAILLNVPGTAPNAATCLDGYPMSQNGEGGKALGVAATASAAGAIIGIIFLLMLIPVAREVVLLFASPEFFMVTIFGIVVIAFITQGQFLKGLIAGGLGLMFGLVGFAPMSGSQRYNVLEWMGGILGFAGEQWFTSIQFYLYDGVKLVPAVIGVFAISEALYLLIKKQETIADEGSETTMSGVIGGFHAVFKNPKVLIESSVIGMFIGMIPGVGGAVANFISYMRATQTKITPENFGQGDVRGVIASEAANDSKDGGALVPTIAFGIPGSATTAIILGALTLQGIPPGPNLITEDIGIIFVLIASLFFANILTSLLGLSFAKQISRVTMIPTSYIIPLILVISLTGAYAVDQMVYDVFLAILIGLMALLMVLYDYSRIAFIIGLILSPIAEVNYIQSVTAYDAGGYVFFTRPISLLFVIALVVTLVYPVIRSYRS